MVLIILIQSKLLSHVILLKVSHNISYSLSLSLSPRDVTSKKIHSQSTFSCLTMVLIILIQSKLLSCVTLFKVSHNIYIYIYICIYDMSYLMTKNLLSKKKKKTY